jgi:hypothetical protein
MSGAQSMRGRGFEPPATTERPGRRYLLFAGTQQHPNGGLSDLVETFTSEEAARNAFREIRLRTSAPSSWAQLAVVDENRRLEPMCWFGIGAEPERRRRFPSVTPRPDTTTSERNLAMTKTPATDVTTPRPTRPPPVTLACLLFAFVIVTDIAGPLLPSSEGDIVFGVVASLLTGAAATGLWTLRRWGFIASLVVATLTLLSDAPAIVIGPTGLIKVWSTFSVLACAAIIVLMTRQEARRAYR